MPGILELKQAWVRVRYRSDAFELEVEDHGVGFNPASPELSAKKGIGLVAMRERAELMGGRISFSVPSEGGTLLQLIAPRETVEAVQSEVDIVAIPNDKTNHNLAGR